MVISIIGGPNTDTGKMQLVLIMGTPSVLRISGNLHFPFGVLQLIYVKYLAVGAVVGLAISTRASVEDGYI